MDDLISRQAAIATAISGRVRTLPTTEDGENWIRVNEVRDSLLSLPSAEQHKQITSEMDEIFRIASKIRLAVGCNTSRECWELARKGDIQRVRHGRWIEDRFGSKCSLCGRYTARIKDGFSSKYRYPDEFGEPWESLYCPNCGAKMDLEE